MSELNKYRLVLGYGKSGRYVAAATPEEAVNACFPSHSFVVRSEGSGWVRYQLEPEIPENWPHSEEGVTEGGGCILDVELLGTILVVGDL